MIIPKEFKNKGGVYLILQSDNRYYIGSSCNLYSRLRSHKAFINKPPRSRLTESFDLSEIFILEYSELKGSRLRELEQIYINNLWSDNILNVEKSVFGRDINNNKNPNYKAAVIPTVYCKCGKRIYSDYSRASSACGSCVAKDRPRNKKGWFI